MLQRQRGDLGLYVAEVAGIEWISGEQEPLQQPAGAVCAAVALPEGPVKLIDPELLQQAIDNLVEA